MKSSVIIYAVPIFLVFIFGELYFSRKKLPGNYVLKDSLASITMGIGNLFVSIAIGLFTFRLFHAAYAHSVFSIPQTGWAYLLLIVLEDYCYYWFHRVSHHCRFFWAAHETHHSSNHYNFTTALRQTWTGVHTWFFWLPLPFLGFPPEWVFLQQAISLIYQFFLHTRMVGQLGPLEKIFNTASHHRVHHGIEPKYLDRNFGGILIVWDFLHGTFQKEEEEPTYGVTERLRSFNPIYIGLHAWGDLIRKVKQYGLSYLFESPGAKMPLSRHSLSPS